MFHTNIEHSPTQHPSAPLNADNVDFEETTRLRGALTDQEDEDNIVDGPNNAGLRRPSPQCKTASATCTRQTAKRRRRRAHLATKGILTWNTS